MPSTPPPGGTFETPRDTPRVTPRGKSAGSYVAAGGPRLAAFLDGLPLRTRWLAGYPVCWQSGQQNGPPSSLPPDHTHCSAFAAAVALYLDIYLLRPPHHDLLLLADAQTRWLAGGTGFSGPSAEAAGWVPLGLSAPTGAPAGTPAGAPAGAPTGASTGAPTAQGQRGSLSGGPPNGRAGSHALAAAVQAANTGRLVLACHAPPPPGRDVQRAGAIGHVAIVRPQPEPDTEAAVASAVPADGPDVIMAGAQNYAFISMKAAFAAWPGAWPDQIALFSHETALQHDVSG